MKRIGYLLLTAALAGAGCLPQSFFLTDSKQPKVEIKPPPAISADDITEKNAEDKARALREELEHDQQEKAPSDEK